MPKDILQVNWKFTYDYLQNFWHFSTSNAFTRKKLKRRKLWISIIPASSLHYLDKNVPKRTQLCTQVWNWTANSKTPPTGKIWPQPIDSHFKIWKTIRFTLQLPDDWLCHQSCYTSIFGCPRCSLCYIKNTSIWKISLDFRYVA